jgi:hypothetical protein
VNTIALVIIIVGSVASLLLVVWLAKVANDNSRSSWDEALRTARWSVRKSTDDESRILVFVERVARSGKRSQRLGCRLMVTMEGDPGIDEVFWQARVAEEVRLAGIEAERLNDELFSKSRLGRTDV